MAGTLGFEPRTEILEIPMIAVSPRPQGKNYLFPSLCKVCLRHHLQNFFNSNFFSPKLNLFDFLVK